MLATSGDSIVTDSIGQPSRLLRFDGQGTPGESLDLPAIYEASNLPWVTRPQVTSTWLPLASRDMHR